MGTYEEVELKLTFADPEVWDKIDEDPLVRKLSIPMSGQTEGLETIYFDTLSQALKKEGYAYRIRRQGQEWIATIKDEGTSEGGLHQRQEWNISVEGPLPDLTVFTGTPIWPCLENILGHESLQKLFLTRFLRKSFDLITPGGTVVELAADLGEIVAGDKVYAIQEIELELKKGEVVEVLKLGGDLAKRYPLLSQSSSKYHRGLILAGLSLPGKKKKKEVQVDPMDPADTALGQVLSNHLQAALKAQEDFLTDPQAENLHQYRVSLRRLRSLVSFCRPLLKGKGYDKVRQNLRKLGLDLGRLRELEVLLDNLKKGATQKELSEQPSSLEEVLLLIQNQERKEVLAKITGGKHTRVMLRVWAWLWSNPWKGSAHNDSLGEFVSKRLREWAMGMYKDGEGEDFQDPYTVHELRIRSKKMRYALEQFKNLGTENAMEIISHLKEFQDLLGAYNDVYRNEELIRGLLASHEGHKLQEEGRDFIKKQAQELTVYTKGLKGAWTEFAGSLNKEYMLE